MGVQRVIPIIRVHLTTEGILGMVRIGVQRKHGGAVSNPY